MKPAQPHTVLFIDWFLVFLLFIGLKQQQQRNGAAIYLVSVHWLATWNNHDSVSRCAGLSSQVNRRSLSPLYKTATRLQHAMVEEHNVRAGFPDLVRLVSTLVQKDLPDGYHRLHLENNKNEKLWLSLSGLAFILFRYRQMYKMFFGRILISYWLLTGLCKK